MPKCVMADRRTHNKGTFMNCLTEQGVDARFAATEALWSKGKADRHGGIAKAVIRKTASEVPTVGGTKKTYSHFCGLKLFGGSGVVS